MVMQVITQYEGTGVSRISGDEVDNWQWVDSDLPSDRKATFSRNGVDETVQSRLFVMGAVKGGLHQFDRRACITKIQKIERVRKCK